MRPGVLCATQAMYRRSPLSPDRVNRLHRGASMPEVAVHTAGCFASAGRMYLYGDAWAPTEASRSCEALVPVIWQCIYTLRHANSAMHRCPGAGSASDTQLHVK